MKRTGIKLLCFILGLSAVMMGCSGENSSEEEASYADEDFIADVGKGLEVRWSLMEEDQEGEAYAFVSEETPEYRDRLLTYIDAELEYDEKYADADLNFREEDLKELAAQYVDTLLKHREACADIVDDFASYYEVYTDVLNEKSRILTRLVTMYDLAVNEQYEDYLNSYRTHETIVDEEEGVRDEVLALADGIDFEALDDEAGEDGVICRAVVENTTRIDFLNIGILINLLDEEDTIVDSQYAFVEYFRRGAETQLRFTTDKDFVSYDITIDYWG